MPLPILENALYTTADCAACNLGEEMLAVGREEGHLQPIKMGRELWYEGSELLAWIRSKGQKVRPRKMYKPSRAG